MAWRDPKTDPAERGTLRDADPDLTDLHAVWGGASRFSGFRHWKDESGQRLAPVMVELTSGISPAQRNWLYQFIKTPSIYAYQKCPPRFVTGTLQLRWLWLLKLPGTGVLRWRLGLPQTASFDPRTALDVNLPVLGVPDQVPWVAIIDHGIAFAHRAFHRPDCPGKTRIQLFWDQDPARHQAPAAAWKRDDWLGYGGCLEAKDIDAAMNTPQRDEAQVYRHFGYRPAGHRVSHGTHVLDLAVGHPHPMAPPGPNRDSWSGAAACAPIIAVQLPYVPDKDTSGSGLGVHVLDALHFIAARVPSTKQVVVNLSDGAYGGRHDGHSMTEEAIDDFLKGHTNVHLVVAAGNAADQDLHAVSQRRVEPEERLGVDWWILPDDASDSFCEVWFDGPVAANQAVLTLTPPGGQLPEVEVKLGEHSVWREHVAPHARCAVLSSLTSVNHQCQAGFLLAVGATRWSQPGRALAPHGRWRIALRNAGPTAIEAVHFWVERDNPVGNDAGPRRQSRLSPYAGSGTVIDRSRTLGSLAGCGEAFVVGGHGLRGRWPVGSGAVPTSDVPPYVSRGPGRAAGAGGTAGGPDVCAPCEESPALHGLLAAGNRSGSFFRMNGTSVAAPLVTRWLVECLYLYKNPPTISRSALRGALAGQGHLSPGPVAGGLPCMPTRMDDDETASTSATAARP